jgi:threonine synthase
MTFVTHLECSLTGAHHDADAIHGLAPGSNKPLLVRYDLDAVRAQVDRAQLQSRPRDMWRWRELLPLRDPENAVALGESETPLIQLPRLASDLGLRNLTVKDESRLPTGSFKSRGMAVAISRARELGITKVAAPTAGNAGGALAAYAPRAGMESWVFMPSDTPVTNQIECSLAGARTFLVDGLIDDCGKIVGAGKATKGWFDMSTLKEPYRLEGKKTMGLELGEQFDWDLPDVILYPTGGGTGLIGMWKAFDELEALGWLRSPKRPRMYACQSDGCAPIARAFEKGERFAAKIENARTIASGLRVPAAVGDFLILDAVRASGGKAIAAREVDIVPWMRRVATTEGLAICPETAVCFAVLEELVARNEIQRDEHVVVFNTGAASKYPESVPLELPRIDPRSPIDWSRI